MFNLSDRTVLARSVILGIIYADLAVEGNHTGYLDCEYVWYQVQFFEVNTNKFICSTGDPVDVYCGNAGQSFLLIFSFTFLGSHRLPSLGVFLVVLEGNVDDGYNC